jgi:hypothetical protein
MKLPEIIPLVLREPVRSSEMIILERFLEIGLAVSRSDWEVM